jgi:hypothetical protein
MRRQCTADYKIRPVTKKIRELLGLEIGEKRKANTKVELLMGISTAETMRMKQNQIKYIKIGDDVDDNTLKTTNVIDLSSPKLERPDKKNVSWGNNEYQEYTQQNTVENQNTLFSKLKYIAPNNNEVEGLKSEINNLKTQISILNDKFDKLISKFT